MEGNSQLLLKLVQHITIVEDMDRISGWITLFIIVCSATTGRAQCNGTEMQIGSGNGTIQSPHFMYEHGNASNCVWQFNFTQDSENAMLLLSVTWQRLYYVRRSNGSDHVYCPGRHNLTINKAAVDCMRRIRLGNTSTYCKAYHRSHGCASFDTGCETRNQTSSPVEVKYDSSVEKDNRNIAPVWGFQMKYSYVKCSQEMSTGTELTSTTTSRHTTTSEASTGKDSSTSTALELGDKNPTVTIIAAVSGSVLFLIILVALVTVHKRRQKRKSQHDASMTSAQNTTMTSSVAPSNQPDQANSLYVAADDLGSGESSQPAGHVTINSQSESATYSAIGKQDDGGKGTIHYEKTMKDNVLYAETSQQTGEMVENILYGER